MNRHACGGPVALLTILTSAACAAQSPVVTDGATAQPRSGQHPCARPGADAGWPDRVLSYDDALFADSPSGGVVGQVFDLTGQRLDVAIVSLTPVSPPGPVVGMLSDSLGGFRFSGLRPGAYRLEVVRVPMYTQLQDLRVLPGRTDTICVALRAPAVDVLPEVR